MIFKNIQSRKKRSVHKGYATVVAILMIITSLLLWYIVYQVTAEYYSEQVLFETKGSDLYRIPGICVFDTGAAIAYCEKGQGYPIGAI